MPQAAQVDADDIIGVSSVDGFASDCFPPGFWFVGDVLPNDEIHAPDAGLRT